jgi:hypothetical protein
MMATPIRRIGLYRQPITMQSQLSNKLDRLKAKFKRSEEEDHQVTQPKTLARQQALANACTHGGQFHAIGRGTHLTCDNILISV